MKKCPICGTLSSEKDYVCGVCGTNLTEVKAESPIASSAEQTENRRIPSKDLARRADRRTHGILVLLLGVGVIATGILMVELIALIGVLLLLFGFTIVVTDISWLKGNTFYDRDEPITNRSDRRYSYLLPRSGLDGRESLYRTRRKDLPLKKGKDEKSEDRPNESNK
jgi:hypothetical protein